MKTTNLKELQSMLDELRALCDQLKRGALITPEFKQSYESVIVTIHKFYNPKVIPTVLEAFVCRDDAEDYNWGLYAILNFFNRDVLERDLCKALDSRNCGTRRWALTLLRKSISFGLIDKHFEQDFSRLLADPDSDVRYEALLGILLSSSNPNLHINMSLKQDPSDQVRTLVDQLLQSHLGALHYLLNQLIPFPKKVEEMSGKVVNDVDELIRVIALFRNETSIPLLLQAYLPYEDDDLGSNQTIERMLDDYPDEQLRPYLHHALVHGHDGSKAISILMLGCMQDEIFLELVKPFVHHHNEFIRLKVIEGCSLLGDACKPILQEIAEYDVSANVREEAEFALEMKEV